MTLMIDFPFPGATAWVEHFAEIELPVLRHTVQQLNDLRATAETINTRKLAAIIEHDPLMTLRVFRTMQQRRSKSQSADITTIERSLVMMGTQGFYDSLQDLPIIEQQLKGYPKAMLGLLKVIARSRHAAAWARDWALLRQNASFEEVTMAALLHDFVEILMWCFAPSLASQASRLAARAACTLLKRTRVPKRMPGLKSTSNNKPRSRSSSNNLVCARPLRAVTRQSMWRMSSPG